MITTMHSDQNASPPRVEVITSIQRRRRWPTAEKIRWSRRRCSPGCRCPTWPGERVSLPACCSTGVDECWKAACKRSRLTKMSGIEVGRIFRQVTQCRAHCFDSPANAGPQMDPAVIHHDDVVASERRNQAVFDIGEEYLSSVMAPSTTIGATILL